MQQDHNLQEQVILCICIYLAASSKSAAITPELNSRNIGILLKLLTFFYSKIVLNKFNAGVERICKKFGKIYACLNFLVLIINRLLLYFYLKVNEVWSLKCIYQHVFYCRIPSWNCIDFNFMKSRIFDFGVVPMKCM